MPGRGSGPLFPRRNRLGPSLSPTYTWPRPGVRPVVLCKNPHHQHVNALTTLVAPGPHTHALLTWWTALHAWKGKHLLNFLHRAAPGCAARARSVVLDNGAICRSRMVRQELAARGIRLWYLPAYSPKLNNIKRTFRTPGMGPRSNPRPPRR